MSSVVKIYDVIRFMGSRGLGVLGDTGKSASAGLGLAQGGYTFYYTIGKPYMSFKDYAHSVSVSFLENVESIFMHHFFLKNGLEVV